MSAGESAACRPRTNCRCAAWHTTPAARAGCRSSSTRSRFWTPRAVDVRSPVYAREPSPIASRFVHDELHLELDARLRKRNTLFGPGCVTRGLRDLDRRGIELGEARAHDDLRIAQ